MRIFLEDAGDQVFQLGRCVYVLGKAEGALFYLLVGVFDIFGLEGRSTVGQGVYDHSETPDIYLVAVTFWLKDFGGYVVGGAADGFFLLAVEIDFSGKTEITNFNGHILAEEEIA